MKCEFGCLQPLSEGFYVDISSGKGPVIYIYIYIYINNWPLCVYIYKNNWPLYI